MNISPDQEHLVIQLEWWWRGHLDCLIRIMVDANYENTIIKVVITYTNSKHLPSPNSEWRRLWNLLRQKQDLKRGCVNLSKTPYFQNWEQGFTTVEISDRWPGLLLSWKAGELQALIKVTPPTRNLCLRHFSIMLYALFQSLLFHCSLNINLFPGHQHITSRSRRECWCLIQVNNDIKVRIWVSFCRAGKMSKMWHFFEKIEVLLWLNGLIFSSLLNCSEEIVP